MCLDLIRLLVLTPTKENIILRKARKNHQCKECENIIPKGSFYIQDNINYLQKSKYGKVWKKHYHNKICLLCWKGEIP